MGHIEDKEALAAEMIFWKRNKNYVNFMSVGNGRYIGTVSVYKNIRSNFSEKLSNICRGSKRKRAREELKQIHSKLEKIEKEQLK